LEGGGRSQAKGINVDKRTRKLRKMEVAQGEGLLWAEGGKQRIDDEMYDMMGVRDPSVFQAGQRCGTRKQKT